jgi:hypothetical protein
MSPIINGTLQPILRSRQISYDQSKGLVETKEYISAGDNLGGLAADCRAKKIQFSLTPSGLTSKLTLTAAPIDADAPLDSWQVLANECEVPIEQHPRARDLDLQFITQQATNYKNGEAFDVPTGDAGLLFKLMIHNLTSYKVGQYVLRHTCNISNDFALQLSDLNVEKIYSTGTLLLEITNQLWTYPCPPRLVAKILAMEVQIPTTSELMWGWRKLPSTETSAANNRIDVSTEYVLASWPLLLYSEAFISIGP